MSNRLPETELANLSFMPADQKVKALTAFDKPKPISGSYEPFRRVFPDAINQQMPLFPERLEKADLTAIKQRLRSECKGNPDLIAMNEAILIATHNYATLHNLSAFPVHVPSLSLIGSLRYEFGVSVIIRYLNKASFAFMDLRRRNGLSPQGRRFVFSMMHERFRQAYPDYTNVDLEIWRFQNNDARSLVSQSINTIDYSFDEIAADVRETYEILEWLRRGGGVHRRAAGGSHGPLFD